MLAGSSGPGAVASVVPVPVMVPHKKPGANLSIWRLLKSCPQSQCPCIHPYSLTQLRNSMKEEGGVLPCHQRKGWVEAVTDMYRPQMNCAKPPCVHPFPRPPCLPRDEPTEFLKVGSHFRTMFLTSENLFRCLQSPLAGLKLPIAAFIARSLGAKQMLRTPAGLCTAPLQTPSQIHSTTKIPLKPTSLKANKTAAWEPGGANTGVAQYFFLLSSSSLLPI